ncbi:MAG: hypothetical protein M1813_004475 [Trichoglossum hirsutum]|nr:MAG: hypothetical protein M1813_004475 [Trichoglossum hirsutum]
MHQQSYVSADNATPTITTIAGKRTAGIFANIPYLGLSAVAGVIACIAAAVTVLVHSNGQQIHQWSVQPTVWLAVISAIAGACLHFALVQGVTITWWRKATHGSTIADLHHCWAVGNGIFPALFAGRRFNLVALATILSTLAIVNGPLLQRASVVVNHTLQATTDLKVHINTDWQGVYSGFITGRGHQTATLTKDFVKVMQGFTNREAINMNYTGCVGSCNAVVEGAGFGVNCTDQLVPVNLTIDILTVGSYKTIFSTMFAHTTIGNSQAISMTVLYKNTTECGVFNAIQRTCFLTPSTVKYPIVVSNGTISLSSAPGVWENDTVVVAQKILSENSVEPTVLGGYALAATNQFNSSADMAFGGAVSWILQTTGSLPHVYITTEGINCSLSFLDPTYNILAGLREIAFRHAIAIANSTSVQTVGATITSTVTVYRSNYVYLAIASVVMLLGAAVVLAILYGWWELGRKVSFSPIEIAKAFSGPMLQSGNWISDMKTLLMEVGKRQVRYGEVLAVNGSPVPAHVMLPPNTPVERRLEMVDPSWVRLPVTGASYQT